MKNNKGFMLAEVVITSTVVLTTLIGLYTTFTKLYNAYNIRTTYFDIDGIYAIKGMIYHLIDNGEINSKIRDLKSLTNGYIQLIPTDSCKDPDDTYCSSIKDLYNIENMYIVNYNKDSITKLSGDSNISNQTFKDYLTYISTYYSFDLENDGYNFLFIVEYKVEYKNGDKYYYSSLGLG